jgi:hypothetical protein
MRSQAIILLPEADWVLPTEMKLLMPDCFCAWICRYGRKSLKAVYEIITVQRDLETEVTEIIKVKIHY